MTSIFYCYSGITVLPVYLPFCVVFCRCYSISCFVLPFRWFTYYLSNSCQTAHQQDLPDLSSGAPVAVTLRIFRAWLLRQNGKFRSLAWKITSHFRRFCLWKFVGVLFSWWNTTEAMVESISGRQRAILQGAQSPKALVSSPASPCLHHRTSLFRGRENTTIIRAVILGDAA